MGLLLVKVYVEFIQLVRDFCIEFVVIICKRVQASITGQRHVCKFHKQIIAVFEIRIFFIKGFWVLC